MKNIKTRKPLEILAVFGLYSFRPKVLVVEDGFVCIFIEDSLRQAVASKAPLEPCI